MIRILCLLVILPSLWGFQSEFSDAGVLVLRDGRRISIYGQVDIQGEMLQYRDDQGDLISIPVSKVDLQATQESQLQRLQEFQKDSKQKDNSLYGIAEQMREARESGQLVEYGKFEELDKGSASSANLNLSWDAIQQLPAEKQMIEIVKKLKTTMEKKQVKSLLITFFVILGLFSIAMLVSFFSQMYLIKEAFAFGLGGWGWGLALTFWLPRILGWVSFFSSFAQKPSVAVILGLSSLGLSLLYFILHIAFILIHMVGSRLKMFALIYSPVIVGMGMVGFLIYAGLELL